MQFTSCTCCLVRADATRCFGVGDFGALVRHTNTHKVVASYSACIFTQVYLCALRLHYTVQGYGNKADVPDASLAGDVFLGTGVYATAIAAGFGNTCAVLSSGKLLCWGSNLSGEFCPYYFFQHLFLMSLPGPP